MPEVNKITQLNNKAANPEFGEKPSDFLQKVQNKLNGRTFRFLGDITGISDIYAATTNTEQSDEDADFLLRKGLVKLGGCGLAVAGAIYYLTQKAPPSFDDVTMTVWAEFLSTQEAKDCLKSREIGSEACVEFFEKVDREIDDMNLCFLSVRGRLWRQPILPPGTLRDDFFQLAHLRSNTDTVRQAMGMEVRISNIMNKIGQRNDSNFPGPKTRLICDKLFETNRTYNPRIEGQPWNHAGTRTGLEWIEYGLRNPNLFWDTRHHHNETTTLEREAIREEGWKCPKYTPQLPLIVT